MYQRVLALLNEINQACRFINKKNMHRYVKGLLNNCSKMTASEVYCTYCIAYLRGAFLIDTWCGNYN